MEPKNLIIICITVIICVATVSTAAVILKQDDSSKHSRVGDINLSLNGTHNNTTSTQATKSSTKTKSKNVDPDYDPERDDSHQGATEDNPITVQQSDGVYTYYGPGHYDYYGGDNHMSGEYYKYKNSHPPSY